MQDSQATENNLFAITCTVISLGLPPPLSNCWVQQRFPMDLSAAEINMHLAELYLEVLGRAIQSLFSSCG